MRAVHTEATRRQVQHDLRGLRVLEAVQRLLALGALCGIAVYAIIASDDGGARRFLASALVLSLVYLALAFRIRAGADLVRRDLWMLEASRPRDGHDVHPYRPVPRAAPAIAPRARIASHAAVAALASGSTLALVALWP